MSRVVSLKCDKCGIVINNDINHVSLWKKKIKFVKYDILPIVGEDDEVYLCGNCEKAFRKWLKEG